MLPPDARRRDCAAGCTTQHSTAAGAASRSEKMTWQPLTAARGALRARSAVQTHAGCPCTRVVRICAGKTRQLCAPHPTTHRHASSRRCAVRCALAGLPRGERAAPLRHLRARPRRCLSGSAFTATASSRRVPQLGQSAQRCAIAVYASRVHLRVARRRGRGRRGHASCSSRSSSSSRAPRFVRRRRRARPSSHARHAHGGKQARPRALHAHCAPLAPDAAAPYLPLAMLYSQAQELRGGAHEAA